MANAEVMPVGTRRLLGSDVLFALGIVTIVTILILPIPPILIDLGLAVSIALSALILMKLILTTVGATIFWRLREHGRAEAALWLIVVAYVFLALRWSTYTTGVMALATYVS